ncbi:glycosyltransferase [Chitinimonas taiwanensis]|uniref:Glycosyl transferase family 2 n=1 Tax=Chitinimonas taiwanensis DSM 18899 TaxID=1121279 RepID=A0A1K2HGZ8_9NEIS|nr:glycosyltransferase [Chitinimonas taiwanensis]SFZ75777.1 Glycosyl transferase family 2 [Chitinimonas taiwanensis DSM 18899]
MPALRVAVITPYHRESPAQLQRCMASVAAQHYPCTHFLISDGYPQALDQPGLRHVQLGLAHGDYGDTPRALGSLLARSEGFDALCYLDADNAYWPEHVASLVQAWQADGGRTAVFSCARQLYYPDGRLMPLRDTVGAPDFVDTNCLFLSGAALDLTALWTLMPAPLHIIGDRIFWQALRLSGLPMRHLAQASVAYTSHWRAHYLALGETPPPDARSIEAGLQAAARWWLALPASLQARYIAIMGFDPGPSLRSQLPAA